MENIPEKLITTYLEMTDQAQFRPAYLDDPASMTILSMTQPDVVYYQFLYRAVGEVWRWRDRLLISDDELLEILSAPGLTVDVLYVEGVPAGYVELLREGANTEIAYFGLRPAFIGRGLGKHLLSYGIEQAWQGGAERVWLHTCNLDGPHALSNYQKRGFSVYKVEEVPMPARFQ
jgi:GNAT superfamily N-acetyltransferase